MLANVYKDNDNVMCQHLALSDKCGDLEFHDNVNCLGTLVEAEKDRWVGEKYKTVKVKTYDWATWYKQNPGTYEFISIDIERHGS